MLRNPHYWRPWQHVLDALSGYLLLAVRLAGDAPGFDEAWNFGPPSGKPVTVKELADRVVAAWGKGRIAIGPDLAAPAEATVLALDNRKSNERLGWHLQLSTGETIEWTARWYSAVAGDPARAKELTIQQITAYGERLGRRQ